MQVVAIIGRAEVDVPSFNRAPEPFDEGIVGRAAPATAADAVASGQQRLFVGQTCDWTALVGVKDVRGRGHA